MTDTSRVDFYGKVTRRRDELEHRRNEITDERHKHQMPNMHATEMMRIDLDLMVYNNLIQRLEVDLGL